MMHRDEAIYARADAHTITLTADEVALAAEAVRTSVEWDRPPRELAHRRALAARLEAASTTPPS